MFSFSGVLELVKELKEEAKAAKAANVKETTAPAPAEPVPEAATSTANNEPTSEKPATDDTRDLSPGEKEASDVAKAIGND